MSLSDELEIKTIDAVLNYIRDTVEITPDLIDKLNKNVYIFGGDNTNYFKEYNIDDFIDTNFKINWEVNNLSFGKYVLENNIYDKDEEEYIYEESTLYRCGDEEEQELQYDDLAFIISRVVYKYVEINNDFILDYLNSYYTTPILK